MSSGKHSIHTLRTHVLKQSSLLISYLLCLSGLLPISLHSANTGAKTKLEVVATQVIGARMVVPGLVGFLSKGDPHTNGYQGLSDLSTVEGIGRSVVGPLRLLKSECGVHCAICREQGNCKVSKYSFGHSN